MDSSALLAMAQFGEIHVGELAGVSAGERVHQVGRFGTASRPLSECRQAHYNAGVRESTAR